MLNQLDPAQFGIEVTINENFAALGVAALFGIKSNVGLGLVLYGGYIGATLVAEQTLTLAANAAQIFVEADAATGTVTMNASAFTSGKMPLYQMATNANGPTSIVDRRAVAYFVTP